MNLTARWRKYQAIKYQRKWNKYKDAIDPGLDQFDSRSPSPAQLATNYYSIASPQPTMNDIKRLEHQLEELKYCVQALTLAKRPVLRDSQNRSVSSVYQDSSLHLNSSLVAQTSLATPETPLASLFDGSQLTLR